MSTLFLRTLREDPSDAEVPSHRLLVRAGYVRRVAPGIFTWLPLGWKVLRNVERIIREEMDAAGFQEVHFPALLPREPYERTGRWTEYGDTLFRLRDRRQADYLLGPTHEELFTLLVKELYGSYRDLPLSLYQIQTKYRDEARPRGGVLRGREFLMKDSYSFDVDDAGLDWSYDLHRAAYLRTFDRLGLRYEIVSAMSGAMGGSASEEFLAPTPVGEDTFVRCTTCDYAANAEAVEVTPSKPVSADGVPPAHVEDTPDTPTIATLVDLLNARDDLGRADRDWTAADMLKNVLVRLRHPDGSTEALDLTVQDDAGGQVTVTMGSYGIGVSRAVPAIVEQTHDEHGLCWPRAVSPADVHVVATGRDDGPFDAAEALIGDLEAAGVSVLYDDRRVSAGVKFNDADLLGMPTIVVLGRGLRRGVAEVKDRASGERTDIELPNLVAYLADLARGS
jgi:prolyl-tRNA synthetase